MSNYNGNKCSEEEEELDLLYSQIEERILLLISEEEEEESLKKTQRAPSLIDGSWYNIDSMQSAKQFGGGGYYGWENIWKAKNKPWNIHQYDAKNIERKRISDFSRGRRGTGVFIPKSLRQTC